jgi:hypothetical protein
MKKVLFFVALATFTAGTISSCGKSTKGKMDGEWTIDAFEQTGVYTSYSGNKETNKESISGTTYTDSYENSGNPSWNGTSVATVTKALWTIKKDGTWERTVTYTETSGSTTYTTSRVESGEWDFLSGVGEYKKNERIAFNTLSYKVTYSETSGGVTDSDTYSDTYLDGEVASIFVITESKKKSLKMEFEGNNVYTDSDGDKSTSTIKGSYTLSASK